MQLFGVDARVLALTFVVATVVTAIELITTKYPRTPGFVTKSRWFYAYILVYGALGATALALLPLVGSEIRMTGVGLENPWVKALLVGFSVKAVLHIRIVTVSTGPNQSFPVGLETLVQLFEPWMLTSLELDHFSAQQAFIKPRAAKQGSLAAAKKAALSNIPPGFPAAVKTALIGDINRCMTAQEVLSAYLKYVGIKLTDSTFPA
jgi:hypothetical protein